jgi:hypothetical protein
MIRDRRPAAVNRSVVQWPGRKVLPLASPTEHSVLHGGLFSRFLLLAEIKVTARLLGLQIKLDTCLSLSARSFWCTCRR